MKKKLLLVDDHKIVRDGLRMIFGNSPDYTIVAEAEDGDEAVLLAKKQKPDVIIMDISMPKLNGLKAAKLIKKENKDIKIIMLSVHSEEEYISQAKQAGADGYILKSSRKSNIIQALDHAMRNETFFLAESPS